jgi:hypothetical protein
MEASRVFDHPTGRWLRTGECSHCGECCQGCDLLKMLEGRSHCSVHGQMDTYYGTGCHEHPRCPQDASHTPSCTYRFERLD